MSKNEAVCPIGISPDSLKTESCRGDYGQPRMLDICKAAGGPVVPPTYTPGYAGGVCDITSIGATCNQTQKDKLFPMRLGGCSDEKDTTTGNTAVMQASMKRWVDYHNSYKTVYHQQRRNAGKYPYVTSVCGNGKCVNPWKPGSDVPQDKFLYATQNQCCALENSGTGSCVDDCKCVYQGTSSSILNTHSGGDVVACNLDDMTGKPAVFSKNKTAASNVRYLRDNRKFKVVQLAYPVDGASKWEACCKPGALTAKEQSRWCHPDWYPLSDACGKSKHTRDMCGYTFLGDAPGNFDDDNDIQKLLTAANAMTDKRTCEERGGFVWSKVGDTYKCKVPRLLYDARCSAGSAHAAAGHGKYFDAAVKKFCVSEYKKNERAKSLYTGQAEPGECEAIKDIGGCADKSVCSWDHGKKMCKPRVPKCSAYTTRQTCPTSDKQCMWKGRLVSDEDGGVKTEESCVPGPYGTNSSYTMPRVCWIQAMRMSGSDGVGKCSDDSDMCRGVPKGSEFYSLYEQLSANACSQSQSLPVSCWHRFGRAARKVQTDAIRLDVVNGSGVTQKSISDAVVSEISRAGPTARFLLDNTELFPCMADENGNKPSSCIGNKPTQCPALNGCCCNAVVSVDNLKMTGDYAKLSVNNSGCSQMPKGCKISNCTFVMGEKRCSGGENSVTRTDDKKSSSSSSSGKSENGSGTSSSKSSSSSSSSKSKDENGSRSGSSTSSSKSSSSSKPKDSDEQGDKKSTSSTYFTAKNVIIASSVGGGALLLLVAIVAGVIAYRRA